MQTARTQKDATVGLALLVSGCENRQGYELYLDSAKTTPAARKSADAHLFCCYYLFHSPSCYNLSSSAVDSIIATDRLVSSEQAASIACENFPVGRVIRTPRCGYFILSRGSAAPIRASRASASLERLPSNTTFAPSFATATSSTALPSPFKHDTSVSYSIEPDS